MERLDWNAPEASPLHEVREALGGGGAPGDGVGNQSASVPV